VHLKDLNVLPQITRITKPKPLLQQQKLDFKTTAFFIKKHTLPKEKRKQPTHFKQKRNHITERELVIRVPHTNNTVKHEQVQSETTIPAVSVLCTP
jgi:hypothetical protein